MATAGIPFRKLRWAAALSLVLGTLLPSCFVYSEELLDSDVVSLGEGDGTSRPAQQKLESSPKKGLNQLTPQRRQLEPLDVANPVDLNPAEGAADAGGAVSP